MRIGLRLLVCFFASLLVLLAARSPAAQTLSLSSAAIACRLQFSR